MSFEFADNKVTAEFELPEGHLEGIGTLIAFDIKVTQSGVYILEANNAINSRFRGSSLGEDRITLSLLEFLNSNTNKIPAVIGSNPFGSIWDDHIRFGRVRFLREDQLVKLSSSEIATYYFLNHNPDFSESNIPDPRFYINSGMMVDLLNRKSAFHDFMAESGLVSLRPLTVITNPLGFLENIPLIHKKFTDHGTKAIIFKKSQGSMARGSFIVETNNLPLFVRNTDDGFVRKFNKFYLKENKPFLIESYEASNMPFVLFNLFGKSVIKNFDPTLRVLVGGFTNHGVITLEAFSSYWKFPLFSLDRNPSLDNRSSRISNARELSLKPSSVVDSETLGRVMPIVFETTKRILLKGSMYYTSARG